MPTATSSVQQRALARPLGGGRSWLLAVWAQGARGDGIPRRDLVDRPPGRASHYMPPPASRRVPRRVDRLLLRAHSRSSHSPSQWRYQCFASSRSPPANGRRKITTSDHPTEGRPGRSRAARPRRLPRPSITSAIAARRITSVRRAPCHMPMSPAGRAGLASLRELLLGAWVGAYFAGVGRVPPWPPPPLANPDPAANGPRLDRGVLSLP